MFKRVDKLLIGKDIDRDAQVVDGAILKTIIASTGMAEGEVVVLDKNKNVLAAGATVADTDTIFICQGTGDTFDYTDEQGNAVSTNRKVLFSDPIEGAKVRSFQARSYTAKVEQTAAVTLTGLVPVAGTEYIIRIVYKDIKEHPGQFTQTYRIIATAADAAAVDTFGASLAAKVNAHSGRRVTASYTSGTDVLLLTGRVIPECTSALSDIDEFTMVEFEVAFNYVDSDGNWQTITSTSTTVTITGPTKGSGNWEQVRDLEKAQLGHLGLTNKTLFPILAPDINTVKGGFYDFIVIESDKSYVAPNNQGVEQTPLTTVIVLATASDGVNANGQAANILARLNPWMASTPGAFANISI